MTIRGLALVTALGGTAVGVSRLLVRGALTVDLGIGRSMRPLGPITVHIDAPREVVYEVIAAPYLRRTPRALEGKLRVVERGTDMVLAAHFTAVGRLVATTLETVRFDAPHIIHFRLVRGPVPHVVERFVLSEADGGTGLEYVGELGTDVWSLGRWWGDRVSSRWEAAVRNSLAAVKAEAERRASRD
ncbi:MAG: SRPBCC family protein [Gaiellaceae bacterium]